MAKISFTYLGSEAGLDRLESDHPLECHGLCHRQVARLRAVPDERHMGAARIPHGRAY